MKNDGWSMRMELVELVEQVDSGGSCSPWRISLLPLGRL